MQGKAAQNLYLAHTGAVASSLLEQGIPAEVIARAVTNGESSKEGADFLALIGVTEHTGTRFLPLLSSFQHDIGALMLLGGACLSVLLFSGTFIFLWKRERLYGDAAKVIANFTEGDFSRHIQQMKEGTIYRLLTSVDQLATILQSENETGHKSREFLKNTIADIAHQLKTPLAALTMYHEIISDEPDHPDLVKEYSEKTGATLKRMEQLIQALLKITRLDAGCIIFEKGCYPIPELISRSVHELTARAVNEGKEILIDGPPDERVVCDLQWTGEAIGNIVKNALDHTEQKGKIRISWERTPAMIRIFISDNGSGILPQDLHHIFKRFYRSRNSLDLQGVGLGLSMAKSIVEEQGGILSVESVFREGTTFTLSFLTEL
ncbi:HAMP domain-containing sensor histidine kinase [Lachnospiraceae bacterium 54-53]